MKSIDVVCIGVVLLDLPLGPINESVFHRETTLVGEIKLTTGGDAFNEAVILSRLGRSVALMGHIGDDMLGQLIVERCKEEAIDHSRLVRLAGDTRVNVVLIKEDGQRCFIKSKGAGSAGFTENEIDFELIKRTKVVSLASIFSSKLKDPQVIYRIVKTAKDYGAITFADTVPMKDEETLDLISEALPYIDFFMPNLEEAKMLTGTDDPEKIAECILNYGVKNVIIKMGARGCFIKNSDKNIMITGYKAQAIDTTGAGDNFAAGFISSVLEGKDIEECGRYANLTAAVSTESIGAVTGVTGIDMIEKWQGENE